MPASLGHGGLGCWRAAAADGNTASVGGRGAAVRFASEGNRGQDGPRWGSKQQALERYEELLGTQKRIKMEMQYVKEALRRFESESVKMDPETAGPAAADDGAMYTEVVSRRAPKKQYCLEHFGEVWWEEHSTKHVRKVLVERGADQ